MRTRLTDAFAIRNPILCAPMAFVTGGRLAAAVCDAGGLGIVGGGFAGILRSEPDLAGELAHVQGRRYGIGFITWAVARAPEMLDMALSYSPYCVFLSFGDPRPFAERIRRSGAKLICQVQCLRHVEEALEAGADAIVAQGTEAGGHGAVRSTLPLVPEVADHLSKRSAKALLIAAGGIADGRGLAAALMLGADGVLVGTRFWASEEALTPAAATDRGIAATGDDTVRSKAIDAVLGMPWPEEFSFRLIRNAFTDEWARPQKDAAFGSAAASYAEAKSRKDFSRLAIVAGECIGIIRDRPPAARIIDAMMAQANGLLAHASSLDFTDCKAGHA
jgi:nitronate monooxygenase